MWQKIETLDKKLKRFDVYYTGEKSKGFIMHQCYWHKKAERIQGGYCYSGERPPYNAPATHWMPCISPPNISGDVE